MVRDFIAELKRDGRTVILCTHNLDEAERLCDRVGVLRQSLIRVDTPSNMRQSLFGRRTIVRLNAPPNGILAVVRRLDFARDAQQIGQEIVVPLEYPEVQNPTLIKTIVEAGGGVISVTEQSASLEDVYLNLITITGHGEKTQLNQMPLQGKMKPGRDEGKADEYEKGHE
jgi:ABC-2 type transport system ATP-binding protein